MSKYFVYVIRGKNYKNKIKYYIGSTNDLYRRIRQHNCEIVGGAKATKGYKWTYCAIFGNIDSHISALQIEWRLKHVARSYNIYNKIFNFFAYINQYKKPSPKSDILKNKLFLYINHNLIGLNDNHLNSLISEYILIFKCMFDEHIIEHMMS
jgi:predicted GIY-YIG superfamily endonuclease